MNRILVIVVTYNAMKWADRCFGSLRNSALPADVFVVDNGSCDGTQDYLEECFPEVHLYRNNENSGFGRANNIGLQYAVERGYEYVYLLNQDAWIYEDTFAILLDAMEKDRSLGILSPMQMAACGDRPDPRFEKKCPRRALRDLSSRWRSGKVYEVGFVMAAHWMISRECLMNVGGFSPAFRHYGEDDNYIHRALYKGFKVGIHSGAKAIHDRELRPMSKEAAMRLKCVASVVKVSNPHNRFWFRILFQPVELLAISVRYGSGQVFGYIFTLIRSFRQLKVWRKESLEDMAFLKTAE